MITNEQRDAFKKVLGNRYSPKVKSILKENSVKDSSGKIYSDQMIRNVFNGVCSNDGIENAIMEAVKIQLSENKQNERKKKKLVDSI